MAPLLCARPQAATDKAASRSSKGRQAKKRVVWPLRPPPAVVAPLLLLLLSLPLQTRAMDVQALDELSATLPGMALVPGWRKRPTAEGKQW